jgi:magnesium transporter
MSRLFKRKDVKRGKPPGSLIFVGQKKVEEVSIDVLEYNHENVTQARVKYPLEVEPYKETLENSWIDVIGVHDADVIRAIGNHFEVHILNQEDIMSTDQRPKLDVNDKGIYMVLQMLRYEDGKISSEQLSIWLTLRCIISFQEVKGDVFDPVRERLLNPNSKLRSRGVDYLAIVLLDSIIDNYIIIIERFGEELEMLEEDLLERTTETQLAKLNVYKRELHYLRRAMRPVREVVMRLYKAESELVEAQNLPYIKDLEDHITQALESVELYREMLNDLMSLHQSGINNKQNEILKVLTVFSVVFIPLTFIAGVYGTNFDYIPELKSPIGYYVFWVAEVIIAACMLLYFRVKGWF